MRADLRIEPILTAALQIVITQILMSRDVSVTLPYWPARFLTPLSTFGVLCDIFISGVGTANLQALSRMPLASRNMIIEDPTCLPARVFLAGENIPLSLLNGQDGKLLNLFGYPEDTERLILVGAGFFYGGVGIFGITLFFLLYHNIWHRPKVIDKDYLC